MQNPAERDIEREKIVPKGEQRHNKLPKVQL